MRACTVEPGSPSGPETNRLSQHDRSPPADRVHYEAPPVPVSGRFQVGDAPRRHLAVEVIEQPVVPAFARPQACRRLIRAGSWSLTVQHRLRGVLTEALEPEDLDQGVVERDADEEPAHAFLTHLLAE